MIACPYAPSAPASIIHRDSKEAMSGAITRKRQVGKKLTI